MFADAIRVPRAQINAYRFSLVFWLTHDAIRVPRAQIKASELLTLEAVEKVRCNPCTTCAD